MRFSDDTGLWLSKGHAIFDELSSNGNLIAASQKNEVLQLENIARQLAASQRGSEKDSSQATTMPTDVESSGMATLPQFTPLSQPLTGSFPDLGIDFMPTLGMFNGSYFDGGLTSAQILDIASLINIGDNEWMSQTMTDYGIW